MPKNCEEYVLITPARNEEEHIRETLEAVVRQTVKPSRWVVVSDGSTDATDEIIAAFASEHSFIQAVRRDTNGPSDFASKVHAFRLGYESVANLKYDYIGNLDADVSFSERYFERLLAEFRVSPKLGLVGGVIWEDDNGRRTERRTSRESVAGAVQLFRRRCFEDIGGFLPLHRGGEDAAAEITAKSIGWDVRTIRELAVMHDGKVTSGAAGVLRARFARGVTNYTLGYHPVFQGVVSLYRLAERPYGVGGLLMLSGFIWAAVTRTPRVLPPATIEYLRSEQLARLRLRRIPHRRLGRD